MDNNDGHTPSKPASDTNFTRRIDRTWLNVHNTIPRTDRGLFIPGIPTYYCDVDEDLVIGTKCSHPRDDEGGEDTAGPSKAHRSSKEQQFARDDNKKGKTSAFETRGPDLVLVGHSTQEPRQDWCLWRQFTANPADGTALTRLAAQLADMARLHLAARPFMRYSAHDLGLDRIVVPLFTLGSWKKFPEFRVIVGGSTYITRGPPLWQSTSLVGCGTFVSVVELEVDTEQSGKGNAKSFIMKNAWHACARLAESTVYKMIYSATKESISHLTNLEGVPQFVDGGDIFDPQQPNEMIKVSSHRKGFGRPINEKDDPVLHRLVLVSHGCKLYEFNTFSQLMRAAKKMNSGTPCRLDQCSRLTLFQDLGHL